MVYEVGLEKECFFWFDTYLATVIFRKLNQQLPLKVNINKVEHVALAVSDFGATIVEVGLDNMSRELLNACRENSAKIMIFHPRKDPEAFKQILCWGVEMANVDHGDLFAKIAREFQ